MAEEYSEIGNIKYDDKTRVAMSLGLIKTPKLVIKHYGMCMFGEPLKNEEIYGYRDLIKKQINKGDIQTLSGLGFSIYSGNFLNVAIWDKEKPIVLKNKIYVLDEEGIMNTLNINTEGAFCIWELGIVNYERNLWKEYLQTERKEEDKKKYLNSWLEGIIL